MEPGDVPVFREEDIAALTTDVDPRLGHGERVTGGLATDDECDAPDVALARRAESLDAVG